MTTFEFMALFGMPVIIAVAGVIAAILFRRFHGRADRPAKSGD